MKFLLRSLLCLACPTLLLAHPIPDVPVIGSFERNGSAVLQVEVDPRCFAEDPEEIPFLQKEAFDKLDQNEKKELLGKADALVRESLLVKFGEQGWFLPDFQFEFFSKEHDNQIVEGNVIVIQGLYSKNLKENEASFQIKALESAGYDLVFRNLLDGIPQKRVNVLWPGEESFMLDISAFAAAPHEKEPKGKSIQVDASATPAIGDGEKTSPTGDLIFTFREFLIQGFVHVLPHGLDHILFVVGLFLFSRKAKPLILQVTTFTLAHTITIALASLNFIAVSPSIIEPLIALSIVYVAIENIYRKEYGHVRLLSIFLFGLVHGLGFAGVSSLDSQSPSFLTELLGFTIGVDVGQLAVVLIFLALLTLLTIIENLSGKFLLSPIIFQFFLWAGIASLLIDDPYAIAVILCLAAVATTILSLRYEKNLGKVADKQSYVHNALHYQKLFVNPGSLLIAAIGIYWSVERIFL